MQKRKKNLSKALHHHWRRNRKTTTTQKMLEVTACCESGTTRVLPSAKTTHERMRNEGMKRRWSHCFEDVRRQGSRRCFNQQSLHSIATSRIFANKYCTITENTLRVGIIGTGSLGSLLAGKLALAGSIFLMSGSYQNFILCHIQAVTCGHLIDQSNI